MGQGELTQSPVQDGALKISHVQIVLVLSVCAYVFRGPGLPFGLPKPRQEGGGVIPGCPAKTAIWSYSGAQKVTAPLPIALLEVWRRRFSRKNRMQALTLLVALTLWIVSDQVSISNRGSAEIFPSFLVRVDESETKMRGIVVTGVVVLFRQP